MMICPFYVLNKSYVFFGKKFLTIYHLKKKKKKKKKKSSQANVLVCWNKLKELTFSGLVTIIIMS